MLSAKQTLVHGMRNEKWCTREKNSQYRAILKLHAREKKLQASNAITLKRKVSRNLKELKGDVKEYRKIVKDVAVGDKRLVRSILQGYNDIQGQLQDAEPTGARVIIFQDYNMKKKQLDKLLYVKEKKKEQICELKMEYAELTGDVVPANELAARAREAQMQRREQDLIARYQVAVAKRNAAKSIGETYLKILVILTKDSKYFDGVLNALRVDQRDQCKVIYRTTLMGQLATENLDDVRKKYKAMARDVWVNMKEREQNLEVTKKKAEDVWEYAKSLVRVESDTNVAKKKEDPSAAIDKKLQAEIEKFEKIFNIMKETMLISSYEELFFRLEDQVKQRERLSSLYKRALKERNYVLNRKNHAETMLQNLEHSVVSTTTRYKSEKGAMLEKIEQEKKREAESNNMAENRGELLMKIMMALQNMGSMLVCVKPAKMGKSKDKRSSMDPVEENEDGDDLPTKTCEEPMETDSIALLKKVAQKAMTMLSATSFELNPQRAIRAKDLYETYIADYQSNLRFGGEETEPTGMEFEHEAVDADVLTRVDIKLKSKQIVEANTREDD
ncbi:uncharacterized protein LOC106647092 [Copidosoma floridanum]|uniref:uncharacterized protein LOC106647092 n=1 Tax=Copidosoma floridanum TaxID=29053 RepID=UPI0006C96629|nr:uncharacterized protein LOC106647092 [Copidosoma floridanum]